MADYVVVDGARTWYDEHGDGEPVVLLHPGGAGGDSRAFGPNLGGPAHQLGCSAGATVALLVALRRPDLIRRLVLVAGVFRHNGWVPQAIDPDNRTP